MKRTRDALLRRIVLTKDDLRNVYSLLMRKVEAEVRDESDDDLPTRLSVHVESSNSMTTEVEIKTGRRSVLDFVLAPIKETLHGAGRER